MTTKGRPVFGEEDIFENRPDSVIRPLVALQFSRVRSVHVALLLLGDRTRVADVRHTLAKLVGEANRMSNLKHKAKKGSGPAPQFRGTGSTRAANKLRESMGRRETCARSCK